jgi:hypothetical protein
VAEELATPQENILPMSNSDMVKEEIKENPPRGHRAELGRREAKQVPAKEQKEVNGPC